MDRKDRKSRVVREGVSRAAHRSLLHALGWDRSSAGRPVIGIANSFSELIPGHRDLRTIAEHVKEGIWSEG
jgi:dihydroxy-acid dehydratase